VQDAIDLTSHIGGQLRIRACFVVRPIAFGEERGAEMGNPPITQDMTELMEDFVILRRREVLALQPGPEIVRQLILPIPVNPPKAGALPQLDVLIEIRRPVEVETLIRGCLEEREVWFRANGPPALVSSAHERFRAVSRVQESGVGLVLTWRKPCLDPSVDSQDAQTLYRFEASRLKKNVDAPSLRSDPGDLSEKFRVF
jgi:hypothetical protein